MKNNKKENRVMVVGEDQNNIKERSESEART